MDDTVPLATDNASRGDTKEVCGISVPIDEPTVLIHGAHRHSDALECVKGKVHAGIIDTASSG